MKILSVITVLSFAAASSASSTWTYEGQWGTKGSGEGQFYGPHGIDVPRAENVYVVDSYNHRVQYFTSSGSFLGKFGSQGSGNGQFFYPARIDTSSDDIVYVADRMNYRVQYFTRTGLYLGKW
jgi:tripartite motif-containing protein 71